MKRTALSFYFFFICCFFTAALQAQISVGTGLIFDDKAYNKTPHLPKYSGSKYNNIPLKVSLKPYCPTPGNQGDYATCIGWAFGYNALSILRAIKAENKDTKQITRAANSAYYVYDQIKVENSCEQGTKMTDALKILNTKGDCLADVYDTQYDCDKSNRTQSIVTPSTKIKDFAAVFYTDDEAAVKIDKTKKAIASKTPVIVGMAIPNSFTDMPLGQKTWQPLEDEAAISGHALVVIGYDEIREAFEVINSWGTEWANQGYVFIKYDDFANYCKYGFQMVLEEETAVVNTMDDEPASVEVTYKVNLTGDFLFRYPNGYIADANGMENINFETAAVNFSPESNSYQTVQKDWKVNDLFQLVAKDIPVGNTAYIFSINPANEVNLHWPKKEVEKIGVPIAEFIPNQDAEIVIPDEEEALQLSHTGTDYLVVLFSDRKIDDLEDKLRALPFLDGPINQRLQKVFKDALIPFSAIDYQTDFMGFSYQSNLERAYIVPMILGITAK